MKPRALLVQTLFFLLGGSSIAPDMAAQGILDRLGQPKSAPYAAPGELRDPVVFPFSMDSLSGTPSPSFGPDGATMYFTVERPPHGRMPKHSVIALSVFANGRWNAPEWLSFSGQHQDGSPTVSPDGTRLFFWSYRSSDNPDGPEQQESDIWFVERAGSGWSAPERLGPPINSKDRDYMGSVTRDGSIYFSSKRSGGKGKGDLYYSRRAGGQYAEPENLGETVNTPYEEFGGAISPDGQLLVFASDKPGTLGKWDLYVSRRRGGTWQPARNLGDRINSTSMELGASFSPDGRYFFFGSDRTGKSQMYQVESSVLVEMAFGFDICATAPLLHAVKTRGPRDCRDQPKRGRLPVLGESWQPSRFVLFPVRLPFLCRNGRRLRRAARLVLRSAAECITMTA